MDAGVPRSHGKSSGNQPSRIAHAGVAVTAGWTARENRIGGGSRRWFRLAFLAPLRTRPRARGIAISGSSFRSPGGRCQRFFGVSTTSPSIRLPKLGPAASALRARTPLARQLRSGRRVGKALSGIHPAPCREGIGATEPRSSQRRRHQGKPGIAMCYLVWPHSWFQSACNERGTSWRAAFPRVARDRRRLGARRIADRAGRPRAARRPALHLAGPARRRAGDRGHRQLVHGPVGIRPALEFRRARPALRGGSARRPLPERRLHRHAPALGGRRPQAQRGHRSCSARGWPR